VQPASAPQGYSPSQPRAVCKLTTDNSLSRIAIVDSYSDSHAKSDLALYSKTFGLPCITDLRIQIAAQLF